MVRSKQFNRRRTVIRRFGLAAGLGALWFAQSSVVAWWNRPTEDQVIAGRELFKHKWTEHDSLAGGGDGLGPVFNATSCVECHFQGAIGGAGPSQFNVKTFEILPTKRNPLPMSGIVHASATREDLIETESTVRRYHPVVKGGQKIIGGCRIDIVDFDPVHYDSSNTPALFGSGQIDRISGLAIRSHSMKRSITGMGNELELDFHATPSGRLRVLSDGRIGKYGWKAQFATLKEFVSAACAGELGLSNPMKKQHVPQEYREDTDAKLDMTRKQFNSLVAFVERIPAPRKETLSDPAAQAIADQGEKLFSSVGCADCHVPNMGGVQGVYSDFCLYRMTDSENSGYTKEPDVPFPRHLPSPDEWKTPPLWGVADSAPYFHDGLSQTLEAAIERHGGAGRHVRQRYRELHEYEQRALVAFLMTLRAPIDPDAPQPAVAQN